MRLHRIVPLSIAAILVTAGWGLRKETAGSGASGESSPKNSAPALATRRTEQPPAAERVVAFLAPERPNPGRVPQTPVALSEDSAALVAETSALQLLAQDTELDLNARQWSALAAVTLNIQAVRQAYEATIATATKGVAGRTRIEVPAYASAGDALRAKFHAELREQLGEANAAEIVEKLGAQLEGHFAGFGVSVQTLDITLAPLGDTAGCEVTRTVQYWNSVAGENRLTTRRETHFPGLEDPSGQNWSAWLSLASEAAAPGAKG